MLSLPIAAEMLVSYRAVFGLTDRASDLVQAMKDYDYMRDCTKGPTDYFVTTGERYVDRYVMGRVIGDPAQLGVLEKKTPIGPWEDDPTPIGGTRHKVTKIMWWKGFRDRGVLGAFGGVLLLGPMWLMVLHQTRYTGLITTTVCVIIFGGLASWRLEKPMDVLSATAAYAAVLVVFVGLTSS